MQYDWYPYKKRGLGGRQHRHKDGRVTIQQEGHHLQAKERNLKEIKPEHTLISGF